MLIAGLPGSSGVFWWGRRGWRVRQVWRLHCRYCRLPELGAERVAVVFDRRVGDGDFAGGRTY